MRAQKNRLKQKYLTEPQVDFSPWGGKESKEKLLIFFVKLAKILETFQLNIFNNFE